MSSSVPDRWDDACTAAAILAVDPAGVVGISLRSAAGPVRDCWLAHCRQLFARECPWYRIPLNVSDDRLLGGLNLAATLQAGRPVFERGILAAAQGGVITLSMAERLPVGTAAKVGCVLDRREVVLERDGFARRIRSQFAVIALDEGIEPDERPPGSLLERLAFHLDLNGIPLASTVDSRYDIPRAASMLPEVSVANEVFSALCEVSAAFGVTSARAAWFALRAARALAALDGRIDISEEDVARAARLVFAPRAIMAPLESPPQQPEQQPPPQQQQAEPPQPSQQPQQQPPQQADAPQPSQDTADTEPQSQPATGSMGERVLASVKAFLPANFLSQLQTSQSARTTQQHGGRGGGEHASSTRGRPIGTRPGELRPGARISLIETLRAAAPWQRLRKRARSESRISVHKDDIRLVRFIRRSRSTTIFLVDASGSAALNRLAEVKGAVELMLAESYVRRDRVALISFRGVAAQVLLSPTNSLVRAKRELSSLPGGGGTPLATGIDAARVLADSLKRRGESPMVVVLTDGHPNITRDGKGNRARAEADAVSAARLLRSNAITSLIVDTAPQPRLMTERFAREMGATYIPLPYANAGTLANVVTQCGRHADV